VCEVGVCVCVGVCVGCGVCVCGGVYRGCLPSSSFPPCLPLSNAAEYTERCVLLEKRVLQCYVGMYRRRRFCAFCSM